MADSKTSTTNKVLRTQKRVMGWAMFCSELLVLALVFGAWLLLRMMDYAGGLEALSCARFTQVWLSVSRAASRIVFPLEFWLTLEAEGLEAVCLDVTQELVVLLTGILVFWILERLLWSIIQSIGRSRIRAHMQQVTLLAQEARQLGEEAAKRQAQMPAPRVDVLEEAIDHLSPTQTARLHMGDPDLQGLEDAVNDLLDRMQAAYSQQTRFVSDASHELRTPIAVLKGYADLLERWGKDDPQVRDESIAAIQAEAERVSRLVEQLLFLARGDSGRTRLQPVSLDLAELTREVWEESQMIDAEHRWILDAPEAVPCTGDRDMLKQALRILADNARKYTAAGKSITLRAYRNDGGHGCLAVRDEGMGIKAQDAPHVFDRFYRSDPARTRQSGGAGLGLAIADWIVTQHGGHMEVYSWEGVGSRFTIVLDGDAGQPAQDEANT